MKFEEHLGRLRKGSRNTELVALMLRGLGEKMTPQAVLDRIQNEQRDMTEAELRHAMETAERAYNPNATRTAIASWRLAKAERELEKPTAEECSFVRRTVCKCASAGSADIMRLSPCGVTNLTPRDQAMLFCATVFPDDQYWVFTADEETKRHKRTEDTLAHPSELFRRLADGGAIPNYAIANQFTGYPDETASGESFACLKTLATRRVALLEFDEMPLNDQARFWVTAIREDLFNGRLRTLVYSGGKSIHALLRVDEVRVTGYAPDDDPNRPEQVAPNDENLKAVYDGDAVAKWKCERERLSRLTEHDDDPKFRADRACKDPTRMTRFAGAVRVGGDGRRTLQRLLWCSGPCADDVPSYGGNDRFFTKGYGLNGEYYHAN